MSLFIRAALVAAIFLLCTTAAVAADELERKVYLRGSQDYANCSAFFKVYASVLDTTGDEAAASKARSHEKTMLYFAISLANEVESEDRAGELATSYVRDALDRMLELGKTDSDAFAARLKQYMSHCKLAVDDPEQFTRALFADRPDPDAFDDTGPDSR